MRQLSGRVALITGASRGIGAATAAVLAAAGADLVLVGREAATLDRVAAGLGDTGCRVLARVADVADWAQMTAVVAEAAMTLGRIDILVNNAAILGPLAPIAEADPVDWAAAQAVNLAGAFNAVRAVLPTMLAAGGGTIINLSSGAAHRPIEGWSAYCASKAGLAMLTQSLVHEVGGRGIRVFGFAPGVVDTAMQGVIRSVGLGPVAQLPKSALADPKDPARAILYLCTGAADDLAGQELSLREPALRQRVGLSG